jgi:hypothetical protein
MMPTLFLAMLCAYGFGALAALAGARGTVGRGLVAAGAVGGAIPAAIYGAGYSSIYEDGRASLAARTIWLIARIYDISLCRAGADTGDALTVGVVGSM